MNKSLTDAQKCAEAIQKLLAKYNCYMRLDEHEEFGTFGSSIYYNLYVTNTQNSQDCQQIRVDRC